MVLHVAVAGVAAAEVSDVVVLYGPARDRVMGVRAADEPHLEGHLLHAGHHQALSLLDGLDEIGRVEEGLVGAGV